MVGSVAREWSVGRGAAGLGPTGGQTVRVWLVGLWREAGLVTNGGSRIVGHCVDCVAGFGDHREVRSSYSLNGRVSSWSGR